MKDASKTKQALTEELASLRRRIQELEQSEAERKKATLKELQTSEEKYQMLVEGVSDVLFEIDHQGVVLYFSPVGKVIWEYDQADVIGKNFIEFVHQDDRELAIKRFQELVAGMEYPLTFRIKSKSGKYIWARTKTKPRMENGRFMGASGILTDITDQKQAEEALRESEALLQSLIDYMHDAMLILTWDGSILFANQAAAKIIEFERPEEFVGHNMIEYLHPDSFQKAAEDLEAVKADKMGFPSEYQLHSVTGRHIWVESIGGKIIFRNASANLVCIRDITERKLADKALRESEERYRKVADFTYTWEYWLAPDGKYIYVSPACERISGYRIEEFHQDPNLLEKITHPDDKHSLAVHLRNVLRGKTDASELEFRIITRDGKERWISHVCSDIYSQTDEYLGRRGSNRDITVRKLAEEELLLTLESLRKAVGATIQAMVSAVEARDPYTAGHQLRTADLARTIATDMGLPQGVIDAIRMAGSIHDIGKLYVPSELLTKPSRLTDIELSLIKEHSRRGYEMLKDVESPWPLAEIIYQHHERMDGSGYPRNLKGDDILMEARIMAVADVVESMGSHRPYRPALGIEAALEEIEKNRGTFYDTGAVDACLRVFREKGYQLFQ
jgi:PAS domain S-box-containing protein